MQRALCKFISFPVKLQLFFLVFSTIFFFVFFRSKSDNHMKEAPKVRVEVYTVQPQSPFSKKTLLHSPFPLLTSLPPSACSISISLSSIASALKQTNCSLGRAKVCSLAVILLGCPCAISGSFPLPLWEKYALDFEGTYPREKEKNRSCVLLLV